MLRLLISGHGCSLPGIRPNRIPDLVVYTAFYQTTITDRSNEETYKTRASGQGYRHEGLNTLWSGFVYIY
jgi:hypothetical protein